jgi:threonine/homoserine/homoserine lactone efflux protein
MPTTLTLFATVAFLTVASPGPTSLLAMNNGARWGISAALPGIAGAILSDLVLIGAIATGLGAVAVATPNLLALLRWIGVAYLAYLGWQLLSRPGHSTLNESFNTLEPPAKHGYVMVRSFVVAVSNPKAFLFFVSLLPSFIDPTSPTFVQYLVLALIFACIDAIVLFFYAMAGALSFQKFQNPKAQLRIDRFSGVALMGMALGLVFL